MLRRFSLRPKASAISNTKTPLIIIILTRSPSASQTLITISKIKVATTILLHLSTKTHSKMTHHSTPPSITTSKFSLLLRRIAAASLFSRFLESAELSPLNRSQRRPQRSARARRESKNLRIKVHASHLVLVPPPRQLQPPLSSLRHHPLH